MESVSRSTGQLAAIGTSGSSTPRGVYRRCSPSMPRKISGPSGRPMGAASCSTPFEKGHEISTGNYRAAPERMNFCWNRTETNQGNRATGVPGSGAPPFVEIGVAMSLPSGAM